MKEEAVRWYLELGGEIVAHIADADEYDFPWTYGTLIDSPKFERFRTYHTDPDEWPDDNLEFDTLIGEIRDRGGFVLRDLQSGEVHPGIRLHHRGNSVWFRIG